jgi:hypothetical protein
MARRLATLVARALLAPPLISTSGFIMNNHKTFKIVAVILVMYSLLWIPSLFWPKYLDTPFGFIAVTPLLSVYLFHNAGIPGLLQHNGACGWGWCAPTFFGWTFIVTFWLSFVWLIARFITSLTNHSSGT